MEGYYREGKKNGKFTFYYESGNLESEGNFENNLPSGKWRYFYPDGTSKQDVTFDGQGFYVHFFIDSTGNKILDNGTGNWYDVYEEYKIPSLITVKGSFYEGKKTGDWECHFENGEFLYKEKFKNGEFKKGFRINPMGKKTNEYFSEVKNKLLPHFKHDVIERFEREGDLTRDDYPFLKFLRSNSPHDSTSSDQIFLVVEESARPVGGMQEFYNHVGRVMTYPKEARRMGIQGKVFVEFVINKDGSISDVKAIKGIGGGCDEEAVRAVKTAPPWIPGKQKGNPIRQRYVVPITFAISSIKIKM
ncbi:MAG: TonB family protein [Cyclobacteriaceae bacterium]|nr:TonB family protein [Cyclobacteriaceae bacterium]